MSFLRKSISAASIASILLSLTTVRGLSTTTSNVAGARCLGGASDLVVSEACLGTMTFGVQNNQQDAFDQLDYARSQGVNFIDTAELYPVPLTAPEWKAGTTETIVGEYLKKIGPSERDELVIATKIAGFFPNSPVMAQRYDPPKDDPTGLNCRLDSESVKFACDASLRRLQTDHIDLYQIHWPDRYIPVFGQTVFDHNSKREGSVAIEETAAALRDLIEEGKIRYIGLSNESPFGVTQWVQACEKLGISDKLATIQNSYSLLDRRFDGDLAEVCDAYNIGLLPWSILAGGLLSGKYRPGQSPPSDTSRFVKYPEYMSRWSPATASPETLAAVDGYSEIAEDAGMTPSELAIAFVKSRKFVSDYGATIVGATTVEQLKENLSPFTKQISLDQEIIDAINEVHSKCPSPSCSFV